jgi:hypothetical protein
MPSHDASASTLGSKSPTDTGAIVIINTYEFPANARQLSLLHNLGSCVSYHSPLRPLPHGSVTSFSKRTRHLMYSITTL